MTLAQFQLAVSLSTLLAVLSVGVWVGRVDEKLKAHEHRLRKLEGENELRSLLKSN